MNKKYNVSVLMAEYNTDPKHFKQSIDSILNQTFKDFELIIVDDCGRNDLNELLKGIADKRIKILKNEKNMGLADSLNNGLKVAQGEYIIRMDTDDICFLDRFEKQIKFAENHPEYSIIGGRHIIFDDNSEHKVHSQKTGPISKKDFLFNTPFSHPTLLIKKNDLINSGGYPNFKRGQDYAMEMNMYCNGYTGYIMDDVLIKYRQDAEGFKKKSYKARILEYKIRKTYFKKLGLPFYRCLYEIKPLIVGLIPKGLLKKYYEIR